MPIKELETGDFVPSAAIIYRPQSKDAMRSMKDKLIKEFNITLERERERVAWIHVCLAFDLKFKRIFHF